MVRNGYNIMTVFAVFAGNLLNGIHLEGQGGMDHITIYILEMGNGWNWLNTLVLAVLETLGSVIKCKH
jgi:hypothetical protein